MKALTVLVAALLLAQSPERSQPQAQAAAHPLEPLSASEITATTAALTKAGRLGTPVRVVMIELSEPEKAQLSRPRAARAVLYDWATATTTEQTIDLQSRTVSAATTVATGDPPIRRVVIDRATEIALGDKRVLQALARAGVSNPERVTFLGGLGEGSRLPRRGSTVSITVSPFVWDPVGDDLVLEGLGVQVELVSGVVQEVFEVARRPANRTTPAPSDRTANTRVEGRPLKPLVVTQPNGPSFTVRGSEIVWDRWRLHFGVHPRRGLEVFDVAIVDGAQTRPVLHRAGLSELITPYGDPEYTSWYPRDAGDYGMTIYSAARASAVAGEDAPANAVFASAALADSRGRTITIPRAVAIYERDGGILWRHGGRSSRARQLVLSGYATVDNYDYLFHWIFGQDGAIEVQVQLTGVMNVRQGPTQDSAHDEDMMFAHLVAPRITAPNHQHFFNWRLDFDVDGASNRVVELNTSNAQARLRDNTGEWFGMQRTTLKSEAAARRDLDLSTTRRWLVESTKMNALGQPTAYALVPGENTPSLQAPNSGPRRRAAFLEHPLWVTIADPRQMYASGEWVSIGRDREGVPTWSNGDRPLVDKDLVLWYTFSVVHLPRPEDWPVMPTHTAGFRLVPVGFFTSNPTGPAK